MIVSLDARGFLLGPIIASRLGVAFVPARKRGKLPGECVSAEYEKEYGKVGVFFPSEGYARLVLVSALTEDLSIGYV